MRFNIVIILSLVLIIMISTKIQDFETNVLVKTLAK